MVGLTSVARLPQGYTCHCDQCGNLCVVSVGRIVGQHYYYFYCFRLLIVVIPVEQNCKRSIAAGTPPC